MEQESCVVCGGDGRIMAGHRGSATCPSCRGSGIKRDRVPFHDVTKTKPSHHVPKGSKKGGKIVWPVTSLGRTLAEEVKATTLSDTEKERMTRNIIDYEQRKGEVTKTFSRLIRKELRKAQ